MANKTLFWSFVAFSTLGGILKGDHSAEEALVDLVSYVDDLGSKSIGVRVSGVRHDSQGRFGETFLVGMMIRDRVDGVVYSNWGTQNSEVSVPGASIDPSLYELRKSRKISGEFSYALRNSGNWKGKALSTKRLEGAEESERMSSLLPRENLALLELMAFTQFKLREVSARSYVDTLLSRVFINEKSDGKVIVAQWKNEKGVTRYTYQFAKDIAWRPRKIASEFIDKEGNVKSKSWECELEWKLHEGVYRQKKSKSLTYFPSGLVQEMQLEFQWANEESLNLRMEKFKTFGYDAATDKFDDIKNWFQEAEGFFETPK